MDPAQFAAITALLTSITQGQETLIENTDLKTSTKTKKQLSPTLSAQERKRYRDIATIYAKTLEEIQNPAEDKKESEATELEHFFKKTPLRINIEALSFTALKQLEKIITANLTANTSIKPKEEKAKGGLWDTIKNLFGSDFIDLTVAAAAAYEVGKTFFGTMADKFNLLKSTLADFADTWIKRLTKLALTWDIASNEFDAVNAEGLTYKAGFDGYIGGLLQFYSLGTLNWKDCKEQTDKITDEWNKQDYLHAVRDAAGSFVTLFIKTGEGAAKKVATLLGQKELADNIQLIMDNTDVSKNLDTILNSTANYSIFALVKIVRLQSDYLKGKIDKQTLDLNLPDWYKTNIEPETNRIANHIRDRILTPIASIINSVSTALGIVSSNITTFTNSTLNKIRGWFGIKPNDPIPLKLPTIPLSAVPISKSENKYSEQKILDKVSKITAGTTAATNKIEHALISANKKLQNNNDAVTAKLLGSTQKMQFMTETIGRTTAQTNLQLSKTTDKFLNEAKKPAVIINPPIIPTTNLIDQNVLDQIGRITVESAAQTGKMESALLEMSRKLQNINLSLDNQSKIHKESKELLTEIRDKEAAQNAVAISAPQSNMVFSGTSSNAAEYRRSMSRYSV